MDVTQPWNLRADSVPVRLQTAAAVKVENVMKATHLVAGGEGVPLKRTPKLLAGMGRCRYVVDVAWLHESAEKRQVLDGLEYILYDTEVCIFI